MNIPIKQLDRKSELLNQLSDTERMKLKKQFQAMKKTTTCFKPRKLETLQKELIPEETLINFGKFEF